MTQTNRRIILLICTHFAAAILFRWLAATVTVTVRRPEEPFYPVFVALVVSQICLIGIWIGLNNRSWLQRSAFGLASLVIVTG